MPANAAPPAPILLASSDTGASNSDGIPRDTTPSVTGQVAPGVKVTLYDGTKVVGTAKADSATGIYTIDSLALIAGLHQLAIRVTDAAGTESPLPSTLDVTIDTQAAAPSLVVDPVTNVRTPTVSGVTEAGATVSLYDRGALLDTTLANADGRYGFTPSLIDGTHTLTVRATDVAGNISVASAAKTVLVDTLSPATPAAPTLVATSDTGRLSTDGFTADTTPSIIGKAEAGALVTITDVAGNATVTLGTVKAGTTGAYTFTPLTPLGEGLHTISVTATDRAGNVSAASTGTTVTIDTTAPLAPAAAPVLTAESDTGASQADKLTRMTTPTVTGTAEANALVTLYDNNRTRIGTGLADGQGVYTIKSIALAAGPHSLTVKSTDAAGNTGPASPALQIVIDTKAPATPLAPTLDVASDTGLSATDGVTSDATPTFTGKAEAGAEISLYDGSDLVGTGTVDAATGLYRITSSALADRSHKITVKAKDLAGNVSAASAAKTIVVDTTSPLAPTAPALAATSDTGRSATDGITSDTTPTLTGKAEAGATVTIYDTTANGRVELGKALAGSTGVYTFTSAALAEGDHAFSATATDKAGNTGAMSGATNITIDTTKPLAPAAAPTLAVESDSGASSADGITRVTTPKVSGVAEANATVTLYDNAKIKLGTATADGAGVYTITSIALASGVHNLTVIATDAAGNVGLASPALKVTIDTKGPATPAAPSLAAGSDTGASATDAITKDDTPTLTGITEAGASVSLYDKGTLVGTGFADGTGLYAITTGALLDGVHKFTVQAKDAAGNLSAVSAAKSVTLDTTAPAVAITSAVADGAGDRTISGTAEVGAVVTLKDGGTSIGTAVTVGSTGTWTQKVTFTSGGVHAVLASAVDKAGNVGVSGPPPQLPPTEDQTAFISGFTNAGRLASTAWATWNQNSPASYSATSRQFKWGGATAGSAGGTVNYYFDPNARWTATEKAAFASGFAMWSAVANVSFNEVSTSSATDLTIKRNNSGSAYEYSSYYPHAVGSAGVEEPLSGSFITLDTSAGYGTLGSFSDSGGYGLQIVLHEEGHFLGLGHAGAYDGNFNPATQQFSAYDNRMYTIMSYIDPGTATAKYAADNPVQGTNWRFNQAQTWMPLDIAAIQRLYGVAVDTPLSGGQVYGFSTNITGYLKPYFDFTVNTSPVVTLWNKGTNNTLNLSGCTTSCTVNLNPGTYSSFLGMTNNLAIAYNTVIDHVIGGSANDTLIGSSVANSMVGGGGGDTMEISVTPLLVDGGDGADTLIVGGNAKVVLTDRNFQSIEAVQVRNGGSADLSGVTTAPATITSLSNAGGSATIAGSHGNDFFVAGSGADTFNEMMAGFGRDTVTQANLAIDRFQFSTGFAADATGAHLQFLAAGANGADTLVVGDSGQAGDTLLLKGITVSTAEAHRDAFSVLPPQA